MSSRRRIEIKDELNGVRIDVALAELLCVSRSRAASLLEEGAVTDAYENAVLKPSYRVAAGEALAVDIKTPKIPERLMPQDIPLDIVYQDDDIAVINKQRGMAVHPSHGIPDGTIVNACLYHIKDLSGINGELRPGIVHRIDKDTTGLLVIAKNDAAHENLSDQLKIHDVSRQYLALVNGVIGTDEGMIETNIARHKTDRKRMAVAEEGRYAKTAYSVISRYANATLVSCSLFTGRTHQIRVHMAYIGFPIIGDPIYGTKKERGKGKGQLLHAYRLRLSHPLTGVEMEFFAPLPLDYIKAVRSYGGSIEIFDDHMLIDGQMI